MSEKHISIDPFTGHPLPRSWLGVAGGVGGLILTGVIPTDVF